MNDDTKSAAEPSAFSKIVTAGKEGLQSPSVAAQGAGAFAPPGAEDAAAQLVQAGYNAGREFSKEYMGAVIRQHGPSPIQEYNNLQIQKNLQEMSPHSNKGLDSFAEKSRTGQNNGNTENKGIEAAREKAAAQAGSQTGRQANQGILSYQSKAGGETAKGSEVSPASKESGQER